MDNSVGANKVLANRSQNRQKDAPPRKQAGTIRIGFAVRNRHITRRGIALPTKDTGPANAVTHAGRTLESITRTTRNILTVRPLYLA